MPVAAKRPAGVWQHPARHGSSAWFQRGTGHTEHA